MDGLGMPYGCLRDAFGLRIHVSCIASFGVAVVRFCGPLLLGRTAGLPGRPWVSVCGLPGALSGGRRGQVQYRVRVAACGALVN